MAKLIWLGKIDPAFRADFRQKVETCSAELGVQPDDLMAVMAFESAGTFDPAVKNAAGSGATGLIQFMPKTAQLLGTSTKALAEMTPVQQMDYVRRYFLPYKGKLKNLEDLYMAVLWPAAVGKPDSHALFKAPTKQYAQNKGLDADKDGVVTKAEAAGKVRAMLIKGQEFAAE